MDITEQATTKKLLIISFLLHKTFWKELAIPFDIYPSKPQKVDRIGLSFSCLLKASFNSFLWSVGLISEMITANEGKVDSSQNVHHQVFYHKLQTTKSSCRAVPDDRFEVQNEPTCTDIGFSRRAVSGEDRIWRKGTTKLFTQSLGRQYLAMPVKLLLRTTTSLIGRFGTTL